MSSPESDKSEELPPTEEPSQPPALAPPAPTGPRFRVVRDTDALPLPSPRQPITQLPTGTKPIRSVKAPSARSNTSKASSPPSFDPLMNLQPTPRTAPPHLVRQISNLGCRPDNPLPALTGIRPSGVSSIPSVIGNGPQTPAATPQPNGAPSTSTLQRTTSAGPTAATPMSIPKGAMLIQSNVPRQYVTTSRQGPGNGQMSQPLQRLPTQRRPTEASTPTPRQSASNNSSDQLLQRYYLQNYPPRGQVQLLQYPQSGYVSGQQYPVQPQAVGKSNYDIRRIHTGSGANLTPVSQLNQRVHPYPVPLRQGIPSQPGQPRPVYYTARKIHSNLPAEATQVPAPLTIPAPTKPLFTEEQINAKKDRLCAIEYILLVFHCFGGARIGTEDVTELPPELLDERRHILRDLKACQEFGMLNEKFQIIRTF